MKKLRFFCGGTNVPASRFRVVSVAEGLRKRGWDVEIDYGFGDLDQSIENMTLKKGYRMFCRLLRAYRTMTARFDGPIVVQRLSIPIFALPELAAAKRNGILIFDFDDAVFLDGSGSPHGLRTRAFNQICSASSHVVAGNTWLAGKVPDETQVTVVPTCIDTSAYMPNHQENARKILRIGWIGTSSNLHNLEVLIDPLRQLRDKGYLFEFLLCSDVQDINLIKALKATFQKWSPAQELPFLQSLDIGLMPLADTDWSKGKCSFKMIQYMAVGCPVVASAVGMNKDVLSGDVGGMLVADGDWFSPLAKLLASQELRKRCAKAARARAVSTYDVSIAVDVYEKILTSNLRDSI